MSNEPLRVNICIRKIAFGDGVGGMERAAVRHIEGMLAAGLTVRLYTASDTLQGIVPPGVDVVDVPWPSGLSTGGGPTFGLAYWLWVQRLRESIALSDRYREILHLHGAAAGVLDRSARFAAARTVVNPHGLEAFGSFSLKRVPNRLFLRRLARKGRFADKIIATDELLAPVIARHVGCSASRIECVVNAVDLVPLSSVDPMQEPDRKTFRIVTVGRLVRNKGYDLLLDALKNPAVRDAMPAGWEWIHFGDGTAADELVTKAAVQPVVTLSILRGRSDDEVRNGLADADLFVQPSRFEGSSLTTLEAMSHGRVIVACAVGGIPNKILEGVTGYLASKPTSEEIANAVIRAIRNPTTGAAAARLVREKYSADTERERYLALYRTIFLDRKPERTYL
ncbi:glycosyltransferase family 4 protein [Rhodococcus indonesiensis]|uniref:glycosyltransferase family 4 protein n=1 Tax=Rhodococcus indonesiensis TaxID=3055869 RepID=UPI0039F70CF4